MPITDSTVQQFLAELNNARPMTHRKMFGGVGIYSDGIFFAVIDDDRLFFKVDEVNLPNYEAYEMKRWTIEGPNGGPMPYYEVPAEIRADAAKLGQWIDDAVEVAKRKKSKPKSKKK